MAKMIAAFAGASTLGTALSIGGTVLSTLGSIQESKQQAQMAQYNAAVARQNAEFSRKIAAQEAKDIRRETERRIGTARAKFGASGVVTTEGTPLLVAETIAEEGELDALRRKFSGEVQAMGQESQARLDRMQAKAFKSQVFPTAVGGAIDVFGKLGRGGLLTGTSLFK